MSIWIDCGERLNKGIISNMTDYQALARRARLKLVVLYLLSLGPINLLVVAILKRFPNAEFRSRIPVKGGVGRLSTGSSGDIVMANADRCELAKELYWGAGELHSRADRLSLELAMSLSMDAEVFLDIGAYTGLFALAVARRNPRVVAHAYEIVPENFQYLWENVIRNNLVERVVPHLCGIGASAGAICAPANLGPGVLASSVALDSMVEDGVTIPVSSLDYLFAGCTGRMVWKIDVEGFEWAVFEGGRNLISRIKPDIICEVLRSAPDIPKLLAFLRAEGYNLFRISEGVLRQQVEIVPVKHERDWLFTTRSADDLHAMGWSVEQGCQ
jgi:FkbM family methyltransferase